MNAQAITTKYRGYIRRTNKMNIPFDLSYEDFERMTTDACYYCGTKVSNGTNDKLLTIDRVDTTQGYSVDNCISCCYECNKLRSNRNQIDFLFQVFKIQSFCSKKYNIKGI